MKKKVKQKKIKDKIKKIDYRELFTKEYDINIYIKKIKMIFKNINFKLLIPYILIFMLFFALHIVFNYKIDAK